jgi:hypothetical protein
LTVLGFFKCLEAVFCNHWQHLFLFHRSIVEDFKTAYVRPRRLWRFIKHFDFVSGIFYKLNFQAMIVNF